jgi:hypothetical protein
MSVVAPIGSVVDGHALGEMLWTASLAGVGVTCIYAIALLGGTRAIDASRAGRLVEAVIFGAVGAIALAAVGAAVVFGIIVMTQK